MYSMFYKIVDYLCIMKRKNVIVTWSKDVEVWSNLRTLCDQKGWSYWTVCRKKFPFTHKGFKVDKIGINR